MTVDEYEEGFRAPSVFVVLSDFQVTLDRFQEPAKSTPKAVGRG
jgi:hypothetical protein